MSADSGKYEFEAELMREAIGRGATCWVYKGTHQIKDDKFEGLEFPLFHQIFGPKLSKNCVKKIFSRNQSNWCGEFENKGKACSNLSTFRRRNWNCFEKRSKKRFFDQILWCKGFFLPFQKTKDFLFLFFLKKINKTLKGKTRQCVLYHGAWKW